MEITRSTREGCFVLAMTGQITVATAPQVQHTLLKGLAEGPPAIVCDLGGVDVLDPVCATVFATVANHPASRWPTTSLLLCGAQPAVAEVLGGLEARHFLPLYDTLQEALDAVVDRPAYLYDALRLAPTPGATAVARRFVRETLQRWRLAPPDGELSEQAQLLADELVAAAVVHAQTDMLLRLKLGGDLLHIVIRDLDWRPPGPLPDDPGARRPRPQFSVTLPIPAAQARLEVGRGYLAVTGAARAGTALGEVGEVLRRRWRPGLPGQLADRPPAWVGTMGTDVPWAASLTGAEQRLLPLLATHLTFREISEGLHLSSHTVKTQAISIYRKLGVSSRSQAIQHARQLGLLPA
jgi:DNA-binding CsgD family transcriptional regulator/anti-anti-sigma regulatory factor